MLLKLCVPDLMTLNRTCFVLLLLYLHEVSSRTCPAGEHFASYYNGISDTCVPCPDNSFMPSVNHQEEWCTRCEKIQDPELEIVVSPCNKTHDAVIHCMDGYYRDLDKILLATATCQKCTECSEYNMVTGQPCSKYNNTICSHRDSPVHSDSMIVQPRNSTHDTDFRCQKGFYLKHTMNNRSGAIDCLPCTNCSTVDDKYEARECNGTHDTVCCPQVNQTVEDIPDGPLCMSPSPKLTRNTSTTTPRDYSSIPYESTKANTDSSMIYVISGVCIFVALVLVGNFIYCQIRKRCFRTSSSHHKKENTDHLPVPSQQWTPYGYSVTRYENAAAEQLQEMLHETDDDGYLMPGPIYESIE